MGSIYDNWGRLLQAVTRHERLRREALRAFSERSLSSSSSSSSSSFHFYAGSRMREVVLLRVVPISAVGRSPGKSILINLAKVMVPEFLWDKFTPTSAENQRKALMVAVISLPGVQEVGLEGKHTDQLELVVKGYELDPVLLIKKIRKNGASAMIKSIGPEELHHPNSPDSFFSAEDSFVLL